MTEMVIPLGLDGVVLGAERGHLDGKGDGVGECLAEHAAEVHASGEATSMSASLRRIFVGMGWLLVFPASVGVADEPLGSPRAFVDGTGPGWKALGEPDFVDVNCGPQTWSWKDGVAHGTGQPVGVIRSRKPYTNFELVAQWRHLRPGGNSGIFVWAAEASLEGLKPGTLPRGGVEVQVLDHAFTEQYEKQTGKKADWFTTHGDVFPVGTSRMTPFPPVSPDGSRSFPSKRLSKGVGEWNQYYVRCINGEVRLWVNGEEVSGGTGCEPRRGYLCLESEGSPVDFQGLRLRELP